nr:protein artichoke-like [Lytechinus pictus]
MAPLCMPCVRSRASCSLTIGLHIFIVLILVPINVQMISNCPRKCRCTRTVEERIVDCSSAEKIPSSTPCSTTTFLLVFGTLRKISVNDLSCQSDMNTLVLDNNFIAHIEEGSFAGLLELKHISFRGNYLTTFPSEPVLPKLTTVDLSWNWIARMPTQFLHQELNIFRFTWNPLENPIVVPYWIKLAEFKGIPLTDFSAGTFLYPRYVTVLDMSFGLIEVLDSLSGFSNLRKLILPFNRIRRMNRNSFQNLTHLQRIDLRHNNIIDIVAIRNLPELQVLFLDENRIKTLGIGSLANLTKLEVLNLIGNRLLVAPVIPLRSLRSLNVNRNSITTSLITSNFSSSYPLLVNLNLSENDLSELIIPECLLLRSIYAYKNSLRNISFDDLTTCNNLTHIDFGENLLSNLSHIRNFPNLMSLFLFCNKITVWDKSVMSNLTNLSHLRLEKNLLVELDRLPSLPQLHFLNLSQNSIRHIARDTLSFPKLDTLDLSGNKLTIVPCLTLLPTLDKVILSSNQISDIEQEDIGRIPVLRTLYASNNMLRRFPTLPARNRLITLILENNNILRIHRNSTENLLQLRHLNLRGNEARGNPVFSSALTHVNLEENKIKNDNYCLTYMTHIILLSLRRNEIVAISNEPYIGQSLKYFDISHNALRYIAPFTFQSASQLSTLRLQHNVLSSLSEDTLFGLTGLHTISLQWNKIVYLSGTCFSMCPRLHYLDLTGNPVKIVSITGPFDSFPVKRLEISHFKNDFGFFPTLLTSPSSSIEYLNMTNNSAVKSWSLNSSFVIQAPLISIVFSQNSLTKTFPRFNPGSLRLLDLTHNCFYSVPDQFKYTMHPNLIRLKLSWNKIRMIEEDSFLGLFRLYYLNLDNNEIMVIKEGSFVTIKSLFHLNLNNNNLTLIHQNALPVTAS